MDKNEAKAKINAKYGINRDTDSCYPKGAVLNTYNDFLTFKKSKGFEKLEEGSELWIAWGPLTKLVALQLDILYESNGLRREQRSTDEHEVLIFFKEE